MLVQLRVGGQAARLVDETLPPRFGTIGQETTGAGGFAKALRTVPVVLDLAERAARRAAPGAWIVDFTNPVGIVTQALLDDGHRAIGLCNVAIGFQRRFARRFGVTPDRVELEHVGLNHLTWVRAIRVDGVDRLPELLEADGDGSPIDVRMPARAAPGAARRSRPTTFATTTCSTRSSRSSGATGTDPGGGGHRHRARLLEMYRDPTLDEKPALLAERGGAFYSEAAAQLIASLHDGRATSRSSTSGTRGAARPAGRRGRRDPRPDRPRRCPSASAGATRARHAGPRPGGEGVRAARHRGRPERRPEIALRALLANPLVRNWEIARPLLDELLAANRAHLPLFASA